MTADPHIETIRNRLDIASCRCIRMKGMQMSGLCPVHGEDESNEEAYLALDALAARLEAAERDLADAHDLLFGTLDYWLGEIDDTHDRSAQKPPAEGNDAGHHGK